MLTCLGATSNTDYETGIVLRMGFVNMPPIRLSELLYRPNNYRINFKRLGQIVKKILCKRMS